MTQRRHRHDDDSVGVERRRFESRGGRYWVEVDTVPDEDGLVDYQSDSGGGRARPATFYHMLASGLFQADDNQAPMKEVTHA